MTSKRSKRKLDKRASKKVPSIELLRLMSIRAVNEEVEAFCVLAKTSETRDDLLEAFKKYRDSILSGLRLRIENADALLQVDIMEIDKSWNLKLTCLTEIIHRSIVPPMSLRREASGAFRQPQLGDGVATYCVWANMMGEPGVAVAKDVRHRDHRKANDIFYYKEVRNPEGPGIAWYQKVLVEEMYKPCPHGIPPYRSIMSAPIMQMVKAFSDPRRERARRCIGVLNVTHTAPNAFQMADVAWAHTCASLLASLYEGLRARLGEFARRDGQGSLQSIPDVVFSEDSNPEVLANSTDVIEESAAALGGEEMPSLQVADGLLRHGRITPWIELPEDDYILSVTTLGDAVHKTILTKLQRYGIALVRFEAGQPSTERLLSLENWLGAFRERQNDFEGKIKPITPKEAIAANTGDSAKYLDPHVDGTQDPRTPAMLVFEYETAPTFGGVSTFVDTSHVLLGLGDDTRTKILLSLAHPRAAVCEKKGLRYEGPLFRPECGGQALSCRFRFDDKGPPRNNLID